MAAQSFTSLRRAEKSLYRELCATFATMQRLDAAHCADEVYLAVSKVYRQLSDEHLMIAHEIERRYDERAMARHAEEALGAAPLRSRGVPMGEQRGRLGCSRGAGNFPPRTTPVLAV